MAKGKDRRNGNLGDRKDCPPLEGRPLRSYYLMLSMKEFVEEMKASGFVGKALHASGQGDATVAPPTPVN